MKQRRWRKPVQGLGLPPGTLVEPAERQFEATRVRVISYTQDLFQEEECTTVEQALDLVQEGFVTWINIDGALEPTLLNRLGDRLSLHPLVLEDIQNTALRPKIEDLGEHLLISVKMFYLDPLNHNTVIEHLSVLFGQNLVMTFQEREGDVFGLIRDRLRQNRGRIRKMKGDYLFYSLLDTVVDHYFIILEHFGESIEDLEDELIDHPKRETTVVLHRLKREMVRLRQAVWPLREIVGTLERGEFSLVEDQLHPFIRNLYDHTIQVIDTIETFRDTVSGMIDIYLSSLSNKLNEVMKVLTIIATIFIPLSFIAGVYGMNFHYMPELDWRFGYPLALIIMFSVAGSMLLFFHKKRWI